MSYASGYRGLSAALSSARTAVTGGSRVASFARTAGASVIVDSELQEFIDEDLIASAISGIFPESEASSDVVRVAISLAAYGIVSLSESGLKNLKRPKGMGRRKPLTLKDISGQLSTFGGSEISRSNAVLKSISKGDKEKLVSLNSGSGMIAFNKRTASSIATGAEASVVVGDLISQMADVASGISIELSISGMEKENKVDLAVGALPSGLIPERLGSDGSSPQRGVNLRKKKDGKISLNKKTASSTSIGVGTSVTVGSLTSRMADVASGTSIEASISGTEKENKADLTSIAVCVDGHEFFKVYETGKFMTECGLLDSLTISKAAGYLTPLLLDLEYETLLNVFRSSKGSYENNVWASDVPGFISAINMLKDKEVAFAACDSIELVCSAALLCAIEGPDETMSSVEYSAVDVEASTSALCKCVPVSDTEALDLLSGYVSKLQLEVSILTDKVTMLEKENSSRSGLIPERLGSVGSSPQRGENLRKKKDSKEFQESIPVVNKFIEKYGFLQLFENPRSLADLIVSETGYTRQRAREAVVFAIESLLNR